MRINRTKIGALVFCLAISAGLFLSCRRNAQPSWDAQILAPVVNANLTINNIITSNYIKNNSDSTVSLVYTDSLYNLNLDTLLTIPDTVFKYDTIWPLPTFTVAAGSLLFLTKPTTTQYNLGGVELVSGTLRSGWLIYKLSNHFKQPVDYYYKVYNIMLGTDTLKIPKTVVNARSTVKDSIWMGGYNINFRGPMGNGYNDVTTSIQVNVDPNAGTDTIKVNDTLVDAQISFREVVPNYGKGYFGTITKSFGPTNAGFPVFNKIVAGNLSLQNVLVSLTLYNGFGVDASLVLSQLSSFNSHTNNTVNLTDGSLIGPTIHVNRATETHNPASPVDPTIMNFSLNPSNSNILAWLDNMPTSVGYALQVTTDPLGNVSGFNDFAYYGYGINAAINVTIPLSLIANNLTLADTLTVNFAGSNPAKQVKSGTLTIYASNGFPFSAGLQMYLLNQNNVVCDSIFIPAQTIASGTVNVATGKVTSPVSSILRISMDAARTQELFNTKTMILYARFNMGSSPSTYRQIYSYYQLGLKVVGNFDYLVN